MTTLSAFTVTRSTQQVPGTETGASRYGQAACAGTDPAVFEPDDRGTPPNEAWDEARAICRSCPIRSLCLADVMVEEPRYLRFGMRGGLTPAERQARYRRSIRIGGRP